MYSHSHESTAVVNAPVDAVFALVDDHARLSSHMSKPSAMMGGGSMTIETDDAHGMAIGSKLVLQGRVLGVSLRVEERVTVREPPYRKIWETEGEPRLLIIGSYRMGFELKPHGKSTSLRVFIDYSLPNGPWGRVLGLLFARAYARWCTVRMANDAARHFEAHRV